MFGRRRKSYPALGADVAPSGWGDVSWRPLPTLGPAPLQIGVYGQQLLNQFPARYEGLQLDCGVNGLRSGYFTPTVSVVPTFQQTAHPVNVPGGQRAGQTHTGPLGPLSARKLQQAVVAAQVRQSGLQAMQWAQGLQGG